MREIWLRSNARILVVGMLPPVVGFIAGAGVAIAGVNARGYSWLTLVGGLLMALSLAALGAIVHMLRTPRLAYEDQHLLLFLGEPTPFRVPVDIVECFFLGQGQTMLSGADERGAETKTIVVRLAEAAESWKQREVKPALGNWCNGYVTIRGTWCEPITPELVKQMNHRLVEIHRATRAERQSRKGAK